MKEIMCKNCKFYSRYYIKKGIFKYKGRFVGECENYESAKDVRQGNEVCSYYKPKKKMHRT